MIRHATDAPHPLDIALGARVRARRKELRMSQEDLGRAVGVTFQQVQKYEHGTNRISFSRLVEISTALKCSLSDLIGDLDNLKSAGQLPKLSKHLSVTGASDLIAAYAKISSKSSRRALLTLTPQLVDSERATDAAK